MAAEEIRECNKQAKAAWWSAMHGRRGWRNQPLAVFEELLIHPYNF
jgi:hypothetical protein